MWKDLFYFSRNERGGILVLLFIMLIVIIAPKAIETFSAKTPQNYTEFIRIVEEFEKQRILEMDENESLVKESYQRETPVLSLSHFDPNTISMEDLISMGLPERLCNTINNFRNSGGNFRRKEDMQRVFGMTQEIYSQLEPYVNITENLQRESLRTNSGNVSKEVKLSDIAKSPEFDFPKPTLSININTADSIDLMQLRGIGQTFSSRIIRYRELLGGFYCSSQLLEVFGMDTIRYNSIKEYIFVDGEILAININKAEFSDLVKHPYISRNVANSIVKLRKQHGEFKTIEDVKKSDLIKDDEFLKIKPYIKIGN